MMTDVYQAAGADGDMPRGMSHGGFDDAPYPAGNAHDVVVVSASRTGETFSQVQGTSLLDVTLLSEVIGVSRSTRQPHRSQQQQHQAVQRERREDREGDEKEEVKKEAQRRESREDEKERERETGRRTEAVREEEKRMGKERLRRQVVVSST